MIKNLVQMWKDAGPGVQAYVIMVSYAACILVVWGS